jgi:phosphoglycolate phosphatase-like HAD superfamily hydrolase
MSSGTCYVFDLDATLVDSKDAVMRAYRLAGATSPEDGWNLPWTMWCGVAEHSRKCEIYSKMIEEGFIAALPPMQLFRELQAAGEDVGIFTSASYEALAGFIKHFDLGPLRWLAWSATPAHKTVAMEYVIKNLGGDVVYIDDEPVAHIVPDGCRFVQDVGQDYEQQKKDVWTQSSSPQART